MLDMNIQTLAKFWFPNVSYLIKPVLLISRLRIFIVTRLYFRFMTFILIQAYFYVDKITQISL